MIDNKVVNLYYYYWHLLQVVGFFFLKNIVMLAVLLQELLQNASLTWIFFVLLKAEIKYNSAGMD